MHSDIQYQAKRTYEELAAAALEETNPEKLAIITEEIFATLEERERNCPSRTEKS
jgi:hypothetical protein